MLGVRGLNSFQLSRINLKGICREVDWLFSILKTVMTWRKRKKRKKEKLIGPLLFLQVDFFRGESF